MCLTPIGVMPQNVFTVMTTPTPTTLKQRFQAWVDAHVCAYLDRKDANADLHGRVVQALVKLNELCAATYEVYARTGCTDALQKGYAIEEAVRIVAKETGINFPEQE